MRAASILSASGAACACANAQSSALTFEASVNGQPFQAGIQNASPGDNVVIRGRAIIAGQTSLGLASVQFKPTITNWDVGDAVAAFDTPTNPIPGAAAGVAPTQFGRVLPFGATNPASIPNLTLVGSTMQLRGSFAGGTNPNAQEIHQGAANPAGTFFNSSLNVVVFRYRMTLGSSTTPRDMVLGTPLVSTGALTDIMRWYTTADGQTIDVPLAPGGVTPAILHLVVPACCVADTDNGTGTGVCDGGVGIEDLLYFLGQYNAGTMRADVDDGTGTGHPDGGVGIEDLLYYLIRYNAGC